MAYTESEARVRAAFERNPGLEWERLEVFPRSRLERLIVCAVLERHLPPAEPECHLLDAGGGSGRYAALLAAKGYPVTLLDISPALLALARRHVAGAGDDVEQNVVAVVEGSITDLSRFRDGQFAAVLCLGGVLSFLLDADAHRRALRELIRVTRPGGLLLIAVLNRFGGYRGLMEEPPSAATAGRAEQLMETGIGVLTLLQVPAYWFPPEEFVSLLGGLGLEVIALYGIHGLAAHMPDETLGAIMADPDQWRIWREILLDTAGNPYVCGVSYQLLAVARRPAATA